MNGQQVRSEIQRDRINAPLDPFKPHCLIQQEAVEWLMEHAGIELWPKWTVHKPQPMPVELL